MPFAKRVSADWVLPIWFPVIDLTFHSVDSMRLVGDSSLHGLWKRGPSADRCYICVHATPTRRLLTDGVAPRGSGRSTVNYPPDVCAGHPSSCREDALIGSRHAVLDIATGPGEPALRRLHIPHADRLVRCMTTPNPVPLRKVFVRLVVVTSVGLALTTLTAYGTGNQSGCANT
jgi:hypothetical protein